MEELANKDASVLSDVLGVVWSITFSWFCDYCERKRWIWTITGYCSADIPIVFLVEDDGNVWNYSWNDQFQIAGFGGQATFGEPWFGGVVQELGKCETARKERSVCFAD